MIITDIIAFSTELSGTINLVLNWLWSKKSSSKQLKTNVARPRNAEVMVLAYHVPESPRGLAPGGPGSITRQSTWYLWRTKSRWDTFFSPYLRCSPLSKILPIIRTSTSFIYHGLYIILATIGIIKKFSPSLKLGHYYCYYIIIVCYYEHKSSSWAGLIILIILYNYYTFLEKKTHEYFSSASKYVSFETA